MLRTLAVVLAGLVLGCAPAPEAVRQDVAPAASGDEQPTLPVRVLVIARADGTGNPLWTRGYVEELLDTASAQVGHAATLALASYEVLAGSHLYNLDQGGLIPLAQAESRPGWLTIVVSRPDTEDSAGQAVQAHGLTRRNPHLVMRSRHADWRGIAATAHILWHEMGHNMGLYHQPEAFLDDGGLHTDNWWTRDDGLACLARYARRVLNG